MEPIGANMTLDSTKSRKDYDPNGVVDTFAYDFRINTFDDLVVYSDEVVVVGGYTLTGVGNVNGGDVIFDTPPLASVEVLSLRREVPLTQETAYPAFGPFPAESHEAALDKLTMADQQQQEQLDRTASAGIFPTPVEGKRLQWNASGVLINVDSEDDEAEAWAGVAEGYADDAAAQVILCAEQLDLCEDEVVLAGQAVLDCQNEVVLAAGQVILAEDQVVLATAQADDAAISAAAAAAYDPNWGPEQAPTGFFPGWQVYSGFDYENLFFRKSRDGKSLQIVGGLERISGASNAVFTLPAGFLPTGTVGQIEFTVAAWSERETASNGIYFGWITPTGTLLIETFNLPTAFYCSINIVVAIA